MFEIIVNEKKNQIYALYCFINEVGLFKKLSYTCIIY